MLLLTTDYVMRFSKLQVEQQMVELRCHDMAQESAVLFLSIIYKLNTD